MTSFKKSFVKPFAHTTEQYTVEDSYWKKLTSPVLVKEFGPIDYVHFSQKLPYHFAVSCSARVQVYNPVTKVVTKNINKFKEAAYGASFRADGQLLCAGGEESIVRLFEVNTKSMLRQFKGHKAAVHRTFFTRDGLHIASFSDDKNVSLWDIASQHISGHYEGYHTDYIRAGCVSPVSSNIVVSGGYDKNINVFDSRTKSVSMSVNHEAPVESLMFLPSGSLLISAGGTEVRIWDVLAGKLLAKLTQNHKTVTALCMAKNGSAIVTASLDKHVKIYNVSSFQLSHDITYPSPVLSIDISRDDKTIVAGTVDGIVNITKRDTTLKHNSENKKRLARSEAIVHSDGINMTVPVMQPDQMAKFDIALRKFNYSQALDLVLIHAIAFKKPHVTVFVFDELCRRNGLVQAISNRNQKQLAFLLNFIVRYIGVRKLSKTLTHVASTIIDCYWDIFDSCTFEVRALLIKLHSVVENEILLTKRLLAIDGLVKMLLISSEVVPDITETQKSMKSILKNS
ncbi:U3 small nucleolar RNA-associated protein 15 homolog [Daktulosphaira vitifoliae]|uniref:U3 small nucleolar RNA-associated protein 15 homolog n=1 Tax=Daktulosphaira vitifoliae TaxID=58002 RepID=UPI0021AAF762|nr:U3 small nucleolar RNA-associated protein 15 homolog [Daktulosphaira vitifoliae]